MTCEGLSSVDDYIAWHRGEGDHTRRINHRSNYHRSSRWGWSRRSNRSSNLLTSYSLGWLLNSLDCSLGRGLLGWLLCRCLLSWFLSCLFSCLLSWHYSS